MHITRSVSLTASFAVACLAVTGIGTGTAAAAQHTSARPHFQHGFGFDPAAVRHSAAFGAQAGPTAAAPLTQAAAEAVPASFDLSQYALTPGDQGKVNSCVTWATGYTGYVILMHEQGINGAPMAPMYVYSQIVKNYDDGQDTGTSASIALPIERDQGIDTKADYWQGDFDYTTQPDDSERANAANYKLSGFTELPLGADARAAVEDAISHGLPVAYGFRVRQSFLGMDAQTAAGYSYDPTDALTGDGHEVTIIGYNDQGVKVENSWGTGWGDGGFFTVPWDYVESSDVDEIHSMGPLVQG